MKANKIKNIFFMQAPLNKFDLILIYPECNGTVLVSACKENYGIKFITNRKNLLYLIFLTQLILIRRALFNRISHI